MSDQTHADRRESAPDPDDEPTVALSAKVVTPEHGDVPAVAAETAPTVADDAAAAPVVAKAAEEGGADVGAEVGAAEVTAREDTVPDQALADDPGAGAAEPVTESGDDGEPAPVGDDAEPAPVGGSAATVADSGPPAKDGDAVAPRWRISGAGALIALLLTMLGFTLVVQVKSNTTDTTYASMREADLLTVLSDLDARRARLQQDIASLEQTKRDLASGAAGREAALAEARQRADALGILAGTLPARGPGLTLEFTGKIAAKHLLNAVQELRGAGADALQIDATGGSVRVIASTYFLDRDNGIDVDGVHLTGPYTITVIGDPRTMDTALKIRGGVVADVTRDGGNVIVNEPGTVDIKTRHSPPSLEYAKPVS